MYFDDGNGIYDVVTDSDMERWREEAYQEQKEHDRENMGPDEFEEKYHGVPW